MFSLSRRSRFQKWWGRNYLRDKYLYFTHVFGTCDESLIMLTVSKPSLYEGSNTEISTAIWKYQRLYNLSWKIIIFRDVSSTAFYRFHLSTTLQYLMYDECCQTYWFYNKEKIRQCVHEIQLYFLWFITSGHCLFCTTLII